VNAKQDKHGIPMRAQSTERGKQAVKQGQNLRLPAAKEDPES
jgi:hypothetical protein